eukprot:COSAG01_NODE_272_length_19747_cov_298.524023_2_plen_38_part_00
MEKIAAEIRVLQKLAAEIRGSHKLTPQTQTPRIAKFP